MVLRSDFRVTAGGPRTFTRQGDSGMAVTYSYDENQRVRALVVDKQSGRSQEIAVTYKGAGILSEEELKKWFDEIRNVRYSTDVFT